MPLVKIWIHAVWATKNREPLLTKKLRPQLFAHIRENAMGKNIHIDFINGFIEHVHCLISLNPDQSIAKTMQLIKGESSFWINKNKLCPTAFEWQDEYFAASVSESKLDVVRKYIQNQEAHHSKRTFQQEYDEFASKLFSTNKELNQSKK
ncbi:MAG: IS200/IS605 family transposase [Bacteroidetes bacterium]|nr:IS200/IS605 family transposase [Bacteroidota bacterium]